MKRYEKLDCGKRKFDLLAIKNEPFLFFDFRNPSPQKLTLNFCYISYFSRKCNLNSICDVINQPPYTVRILYSQRT